jgi:3-oxoacyl-[acyl-carrier protein] reductase
MSEADWDSTWLTDLSGPRALCQAALPAMADRREGRIITIGSVVGVTGNQGQANYAAAKSGLHAFTRQLAVAAAPSGVTVNCIVPGYFETDATAHLTEQQRATWNSRIPMQRQGAPEDVAELVAFLARPEAGYITGQCIAIDGGLLAQLGHGLQS